MTCPAWLHRPEESPRQEIVSRSQAELRGAQGRKAELCIWFSAGLCLSSVLWSLAALKPDPNQFANGMRVRS